MVNKYNININNKYIYNTINNDDYNLFKYIIELNGLKYIDIEEFFVNFNHKKQTLNIFFSKL